MSPEQTKWKYQTFFEDLHGCSERELNGACTAYRRDAGNKFFPASAAPLLDYIVRERKETRPFEARRDLPKETRPFMWWCLPVWKPHWRENDIPIEEIHSYQLRKERKGEPKVMR